MNSILYRIMLIKSFNSKKLRKIIAAWDTSQHPKSGASRFPGQDDEILLKLIKLEPYKGLIS